ncbi:amino acid ABC transporter membrane protein, PAAT family [Proteiniborus ethanoligenes]|uniref:Amino acid ABC transporter membrane protein, PAAT family n=1 Tax=Proteiniborus ethanoligenes TaxID=415015 RepID=A0A1H3ME35_9FIRM|nr:amino acid ABC transporter permease [Proteiniborus ethanoligenes]SDY74876.1 amino acid ABC transporter membrane protein, PAAT family [Proteiniborus ethanoligenes]
MKYIITLMYTMLQGTVVTLEVFSITLIFSIVLGIIVALCRLSKIKPLSRAMELYIWVMRGTPLLLQLIFIFFGLPFIGIILDRLPAALIAFILNYGAYFGEIYRGGIESIDIGQHEAAQALGFTPMKAFIWIIFPQAIKRTLAPVANEVITLVKDTSLVYVVGLGELLRAGKIASNRDASLVPLIVVGLFYLVLVGILTKIFKTFEKRFSYYQ